MMPYEIILRNQGHSAKAEREAKEAGKVPIVICCEPTARVFSELIEKFEPDDQTLEIFKMGFDNHRLTDIQNYMRKKSMKSLNDVRPERYVNDVFDLANLLKDGVRKFFLTEFRFEFHRQNNINKNLWVTMNNVLSAFDERLNEENPKPAHIPAPIPMPTPTPKTSTFSLSNRRGAKIDFIRIVNAMYELGFFQDESEQIPTKEVLMKKVGDFFGTDLTKYDVNLSDSFRQSENANLEIFEKLKETHRKIWNDKQ